MVEQQMVDGQPGAAVSNAVEIRVAAQPGPLAVMRAVAGDLAIRADFDVDAIADVRLAVDEACATLVALALPGTWLTCRFRTEHDRLVFTAEVVGEHAAGPRTDTFGWRVLTALADEISSGHDPVGDGTHVVRVELAKSRVEVPG
ncbi:anti-sigma factor [Saccharopolyspora erythraea]|nr:anti-sigma factor [Saccharopolyspora erythraea]